MRIMWTKNQGETKMIVAIIVVGFMGFGIYGAVNEKPTNGVICETHKPSKCRGFDQETGFHRPYNKNSDDSVDFDDLNDGDFVKREPAIVVDRMPADVKR